MPDNSLYSTNFSNFLIPIPSLVVVNAIAFDIDHKMSSFLTYILKNTPFNMSPNPIVSSKLFAR